MNNLSVKVENSVCGELIKEENKFLFSYTAKSKEEFISLIMPVRNKPYIYNKLHPIFEMHLPEGYLLSIIKKHFSKITKTDDFGLLNVMSGSIKGRVSYESSSTSIDKGLR